MKTLKRTMVALLALLPLATGMADENTERSYSRIFVFGASFMDPGNHFALTGETAHPPFELMEASYGIGGHHFSNGRTWVEILAQKMELTEWAKPAYRDPAFGNYAVGSGRARDIWPDPVEPSLSDQVQAWIDNGYCTGAPMDDTLFIMDSAYFDLVDILAGQDAFVILHGMTTSIATNIAILRECGARNLLFAYIPPLEISPIVPPPEDPTTPSLSAVYNYLFLHPVIQSYASEPDMNVSVVDYFALVSGMMATPEAFGLTNVTDSCVTFGVTEGAFCKDRDGYFLWDPLHPTKKVHAMFAEFALEQLP